MDEQENIYKFITYEMKEKILEMIRYEFNIAMECSNELESVYFRNHKLKYNASIGLWGSDPMLDNIRFVCEWLKVEYEGSETQKLCERYVLEYNNSKEAYNKEHFKDGNMKRIKLN